MPNKIEIFIAGWKYINFVNYMMLLCLLTLYIDLFIFTAQMLKVCNTVHFHSQCKMEMINNVDIYRKVLSSHPT